ncbi:MAG: AGE family epimerase/isomerase [Spirosomataceae bacterium]
MNLPVYAQQYRHNLFQRLVPFWTEYTMDAGHGGYFCVLSAKGEVITTDKWVEWHAQQAWAFALLYQQEARGEYLQFARQGADFLLLHAADAKDNWWKAVDCTGRGIAEATDSGTEAATVAAWSFLYELTQDDTYAEAVGKTLPKAFRRREKRLQKRTEEVLSGRHLKNLGELSAMTNALTAAKGILSEKSFKERADSLMVELTKHFWEPRANILLENVFSEGGYSDCLLGRRIHPGRVFEAFNAFYALTKELNKRQLRRQLAQHVVYLAETAWDEAYGGYFYWLDVKSLPTAEPEASYKYAWVHLEACTALLRAYQVLQDRAILKQWQRVHDYVWQHFPDNSPEGEWIGVLSRHGEPLIQLKATPDKSAYYPIKNLLESAEILASIGSL